MSEINSVHDGPVFWGSVGYAKRALIGPHTGPEGAVEEQPRSTRRSLARAQARQRRSEVQRGAGFLRRLATTRDSRR